MSSLEAQATIKIRRDTASNWTSNNPTPLQGEWCLETDTGNTKIGDGSTAWTSLLYYDATMIGTQKNFFTYKDRTAWGYLPLAFDNAVSTTTYSALYAEVGDVFETQHTGAGDSASGVGMFYPTPIPGAYDRAGIPDIDYASSDRSSNALINITHHISRDGTPFKLMGDDIPAPLESGTEYFIVVNSATSISFATTEALAVAGTVITLTDSGSGTFRLTQEGISIDHSLEEHGHAIKVANLCGTVRLHESLCFTTVDSVANTFGTDSIPGWFPKTHIGDIANATATNETRPKTNYSFGYIKARKV